MVAGWGERMKADMPNKKTQVRKIDEAFEQQISKYNISSQKVMPIIVISVIVDMLGYVMVMPLLPFYAQSFGASDFTIGIIMALNAVTSLMSGPVWGRLSDKYGRKPILLISQAGTLASFILLAISNSIGMLMPSRIVDGLFGGQIPVINATIIDVTTPENRSEKMAMMAVSMTVGSIAEPMIGGYLGEINLTYPAYAACVMSVIAMTATSVIYTETMPLARRQDLEEQMKAKVGGMKHLVFTRKVVLRLAQIFAMMLIFGMIFSGLSLIPNQKYGATSSSIGNIITLMGVCTFIFGVVLMKRLKNRIGEQRMLLFAIILLIAAYLIMPNLPTFISFSLFIVIFSAGNNFARPIIRSNLSRAVDPDKQGLISGYSTTVASIARIIAPLISTGWLQLGGLTIGLLVLNEFYMIAITGFLAGLMLLAFFLIDQKKAFLPDTP
jgi:DHA1 family tetracycline resistance protein-like MFS transporter